MNHSYTLSIAVCTVLMCAAGAQDHHKVSTPLPPVDLDSKVFTPASAGTPTAPKVDTHARVRLAGQQPEPAKGSDTVTLPNGRQFRAGLPRDQVLFDVPNGEAIWAEGAGYKASFARTGFTYVPYFGSSAPQSYPVVLSLESARLGATVAPLAQAPPRRQGHTVTLDRGTIVECYDVGTDRVEQKFVIATPFAGDLTLTLRVDTELQAENDAAGLRFGNALGHVGYTNAVLVDALGQRTAMATAYVGGRITLRAPASALANAVFPVTVDPVVVTFAASTSTTYVLTNPDVAFSSTSGHYLVVWTRVFSATDTDLHSVAVDTSGTVVLGSSSLLDNSLDRWDDGRVASSGANFLAVASRTPMGGGTRAIWGRTRAVGSATMGAQFEISSTETGDKVTPDVGGEFDGPVNFCVVWQRNFAATDHDIHYRMVTVAGAVSGAVSFIDNAGANDDFRPRIAKSDGRLPAGQQIWPVAWQRLIGGTQHDIFGARVLWNGTLATPPFAIDAAVADDDTQPSPTSLTDDIGGKFFLVAYTTNNTGDLDIFLRAYQDAAAPAQVSAAFLGSLENLTAAQRARDQFSAATDSDGCRLAVSYVERFSASDRDAYVTTLHLTPALTTIDPRVTLTFSGLDTAQVGLVANRSGGGGNNDYSAVWDHNSVTGPIDSSINGAAYNGVTPGGGFATRATACGGYSISFAAGNQVPAPGNTIQFDLSGAPGPSIFIVGVPTGPLLLCPPAPCALGATLTVILPGSSLSLLIPCSSNLVGSTLAVQGAAVLSPGGCAGFGQLVTSDTVDVTIR